MIIITSIIFGVILYAALWNYWYTGVIGLIGGAAIFSDIMATAGTPVTLPEMLLMHDFYMYSAICATAAFALLTKQGWAVIAGIIVFKKVF